MQSAGIERRFLSPQNTQDTKKQKSSSIKFNRKQDNTRGDKKKVESPKVIPERIVFISPHKQNIVASQPQPTIINNANIVKIRQSFIAPKDQSYILPRESPLNYDHKMNDSMLSLMQELGGDTQRKYQSDMHEYLALISNLRDEVDHLQSQNNFLKGKVKDIEMIQEFLMERETYISQVTDRNINLNEQLHCIQVANERLRGELRQLQEDYNNQHQMYESYIATLKLEKEAVKGELDMVMKLNLELNEKLQEKSIKKGERFKRVFRDKSEQTGEISPKRLAKQNQQTIRSHRSLFKNDFSQLIDTCQTAKSKENDLSQLNVKSMDEYSILQKLNDQPQPCDCKDIIKKLKQKIRYSQIQIDILKRIKINGEKTKDDNQKLKNQNKKLLCKLDHFSSQKHKKQKRNTNSDSSLELSLSPSKGEHQIKRKY